MGEVQMHWTVPQSPTALARLFAGVTPIPFATCFEVACQSNQHNAISTACTDSLAPLVAGRVGRMTRRHGSAATNGLDQGGQASAIISVHEKPSSSAVGLKFIVLNHAAAQVMHTMLVDDMAAFMGQQSPNSCRIARQRTGDRDHISVGANVDPGISRFKRHDIGWRGTIEVLDLLWLPVPTMPLRAGANGKE